MTKEVKAAYDREYFQRNKARSYARRTKQRKDNPRLRLSDRLKQKYGITLEDKERMFENQQARCANKGCNQVFEALSDASTDHDHVTGKVRALLCHSCNVSLGRMKENPSALRGLADYMESF